MSTSKRSCSKNLTLMWIGPVPLRALTGQRTLETYNQRGRLRGAGKQQEQQLSICRKRGPSELPSTAAEQGAVQL